MSVIVCDIVEVWSSCQKTTEKVPKNKPWLGMLWLWSSVEQGIY